MRKNPILILFSAIILSLFLFNQEVRSGPGDNVSGWAWSENIGWISFNCYNDYNGDGEKENHCVGSNYGIDIDGDGLFSGYAWSENIGWISFADFDGDGDIDSDDKNIFGSPCAPNCKALFNSETREVSGWARVLAYHGSWDGWIRFDHAQIDEVSIDSSGDFHGWAWGSDVVGWINFNGVNYKATLDLSGLNQPPSAINLSVDPHNSTDYCEIIGYPPVRVRWEYFDIDDIPEGTDPQSAYEIEVFKVSDGIKVIDTGKKSGETKSYVFQIIGERLEWNISYNWQVKVWDNSDEPSDWAIGSFFITAVHYYPDTDFSWLPESPAAEEFIEFTDQTTYYDEATSWNWNFGDGNTSTEQNPTHSYPDTQLRTVTLQACDNIGCCSVGKEITVSFPFPEWEEIAPF